MKQIDLKRTIILVVVCLFMIGATVGILSQADQNINRGLDIAGGIYILLEAVETEDGEVTDDSIERAIAIIQHRIDELGVVEPVIQRQGERRIRIELPGYEDEKRARQVIGRTAQLSFVGPDEEVILTGAHLKNASVVYNPYTMNPEVSLEFDATGGDAFAAATKKFINQRIAIYLDDDILSAPTVQNVITDGNAVITNIGTADDAGYLALMLRSGALPVSLTEQEFRMVGPTLGDRTEEIGILAAAAGFLAVLLFMIIYYRVSGVMAGVALIFYLGLVVGALMLLKATLTLPGIAGLILSIGMAVDANVIIFERIKEELRDGRTLLASLEAGFERAFRTILDANVTTVIAAVVLFALATGAVRGFAVTLFIGIICSMFTALVVTRLLLRLAFRSKILKGSSSVGVKIS
jgi:protein-export SecD/SecF family membrane protein